MRRKKKVEKCEIKEKKYNLKRKCIYEMSHQDGTENVQHFQKRKFVPLQPRWFCKHQETFSPNPPNRSLRTHRTSQLKNVLN